jgi:hypothetical protein
MANPFVVLLASAAAKRINDRNAERRQEEIANAMRAYNLIQAQKSQAATEELLGQQTPEKRAAEMEQSVASRAASMGESVKAAKASDVTALNAKPSEARQQSQDRAADTLANRTKRAIENLSVMSAPGDVNQAFGFRAGRAAGTIDSANRAIGRYSRASINDINSVRANPWVDMAASAGMAYGSSGLAGGGKKAEKTPRAVGSGMDFEGSTGQPGRWKSLWGFA